LTLDKILREQMSRTETHEPISSVSRFKLAQAARDPSSGRKTSRQGQHSPNIDSNSEALRKVTQELEQLQKTFNFFVPPEYQELISLDGVSKLQLGDTICKSITVLFSDIRDFTTMSESMFINDLMEFLNTYLAFALPPVSEHGGFIDKFIGDSIMCIFAKPDPVEQTLGAVNCAVRMMRNLDFMAESGFNPTETGIGINTGRTIVGILGTETRMAPTALGDTVNLASRTESLCKRYGARILITEYTKEKMGPQSDELFTIRQVDHVTVKGKSSACRMYEVIDGDNEAIQALKKSILSEYNKGLEAFAQKHFELALASFNVRTR
jgi:class 3 adenylate cyclase